MTARTDRTGASNGLSGVVRLSTMSLRLQEQSEKHVELTERSVIR